ncbi:S-layer homology domain-containing protein [Liberiplasma polymorphum]|uniref:S-layer homology domain-containing protein n=1 Tax=Liberiplasma polymorphum TaxID=3374570 RepID=UPI003773D004
MDFSQYYVWEGIIHFSVLAVLLLFANTLRRKISFLKHTLLPTAVIAGFIGLIIKETLFKSMVTPTTYENTELYLRMLTYHAIALGFIALGLKVNAVMSVNAKKSRGMFSGLLIVSTYLIQGLVAIVITITLAFTFFKDLLPAAGLLAPMGFGQGPGQAQNIGNVYEVTHGFVGGTSFGLAIASFGFIWASIAGVYYLNLLHKQGYVKRVFDQKSGLVSSQEIESPDEIPVAEAIDKFTIQISLVLMVYLVTYGFIMLVARTMDTGVLGDFGINTIKPLVIGFNFIIGMLLALLFKKIFLWLRKKNIMTRQYPNNYMLNRIAGTIFDYMIIASIIAIRVEDLKHLWIPFIIVVFTVGFVTLFFVKFLTKRIYPEYPIPALMGMFGMLSGTASTGIILIREVDPNFKTPAANDLVVGSSTAIVFGFPILLLVGIAPISIIHTFVSLGIIILLFIVFVSIILKFNPKVTE